VNLLLSGSFFRDPSIEVVPEQGRGLVRIPVKRPKIIVGVSITLATIYAFPTSSRVFPAILDIGCNQGLEIDERHLFRWNGTNKDPFDLVKRHKPTQAGERGYDYRMANIWLHLEPYAGPRFNGPKMPFLLTSSDEIVVMDPSTSEPAPRFPLLGLKAIQDNNLIIAVNGASSNFDIYES
jgi:hypothetical protein